MNNNKVLKSLKAKLDRFLENISNGLCKVDKRFIRDMAIGLLKGKDVLLSEIGRKLNENISIKKTDERLCRQLLKYNQEEKVLRNFRTFVNEEINNKTIFVIDNTDVTKPYGKKFENMCKVMDGSTGEVKNGYEICTISALTPVHKQPLPVYSHLYSYEEQNYESNNIETQKGLDCVRKAFGSVGVKVFDRAYDDKKLFNYLIHHEERFVIRVKENRYVRAKGQVLSINSAADLALQSKATIFKKNGREYKLIFGKIKVLVGDIPLTLVVVNGFNERMLLLSNMDELTPEVEKTIVKLYMVRWKVEELFRFEKQNFKLENFRVRKLKAIRNLNLMVMMVTAFISLLSEKQQTALFKSLYKVSKTIEKQFKNNHVYFYSIARAICTVLCNTS